MDSSDAASLVAGVSDRVLLSGADSEVVLSSKGLSATVLLVDEASDVVALSGMLSGTTLLLGVASTGSCIDEETVSVFANGLLD